MNKSVIAVLVGLAVAGGAYAVADSKADAVALERADQAISSFNENSGMQLEYNTVNANLLSNSFEISGLSFKKNDEEMSVDSIVIENPVFTDDDKTILSSATVTVNGLNLNEDDVDFSVKSTTIKYNTGDKEVTFDSLSRMDPIAALSLFEGLNVKGIAFSSDHVTVPTFKFKEIDFSNVTFNDDRTMIYSLDSFVKGAETEFDLSQLSEKERRAFKKTGLDSGKFSYSEEFHYKLNPESGDFDISTKVGLDDLGAASLSLSLGNFPKVSSDEMESLQRYPMRAFGLFENLAIKSFTFSYDDDGLAKAAYAIAAEENSYKLERRDLPVTGEAYRKMLLKELEKNIDSETNMSNVEQDLAELALDFFGTTSPDVMIKIESKEKGGVGMATLLKDMGGKSGQDKAASHFKYTMKAK